MRLRLSIAATAAIVAALFLSQLHALAQPGVNAPRRAATTTDSELSVGPIPDGEFRVGALPDLIPVEKGGQLVGYAYSREVFADLHKPGIEVVAYGIYELDGSTRLGHVVTGKGFVAGPDPIPLTRPAVVPDPLEPLPPDG